MIKFTDIPFKPVSSGPPPYYMSGISALMDLNNGYRVSIIMHTTSYGGDKGFYEIMVTDTNDEVRKPLPDIGDDGVKGYLSAKDVEAILNEIDSLPKVVVDDPKVIDLFP